MPGGLTKITLKKDYASSEMCNNAICSEIFTDMALGIANKYNSAETGDVLSPMMRDNGGTNTNYRLTFKATPMCLNCVSLPECFLMMVKTHRVQWV